jgi:tyrosyl-tRNA synthetase
MEGVPTANITLAQLSEGYDFVSLLADTLIFPSKGEARKMWQAGGLSINKEKISTDFTVVNTTHLLQGKYILIQKGKKNYYFIKAS